MKIHVKVQQYFKGKCHEIFIGVLVKNVPKSTITDACTLLMQRGKYKVDFQRKFSGDTKNG